MIKSYNYEYIRNTIRYNYNIKFIVFSIPYYKSRECIYPLIEKLRTWRNSFNELVTTSKGITAIIGNKTKTEVERIIIIRQLSRNIEENMLATMNNIDEDNDWGNKSNKEIYSLIKK